MEKNRLTIQTQTTNHLQQYLEFLSIPSGNHIHYLNLLRIQKYQIFHQFISKNPDISILTEKKLKLTK